tara:strand:+ start:5899 stop:10953 length:5055 start_codon:yes stop_codon:yes gene_type:complete
MKKITLLFIFAGVVMASFAQCDSTSCTPTTWFLDIDGDGVGVDFNMTNVRCCEAPSDMYSSLPGDPCPQDPSCVNASDEIPGCIYAEACNYNADANVFNGNCLFPGECRLCEEIAGVRTGLIDPDGPCNCDDTGAPIYPDAMGICGGECDEDVDGDGICDFSQVIGTDTLWTDNCRVADEALDDCGQCNTLANGQFYKNETGDPCAPGTPGCTLANGDCDCDGNVFSSCGVCGGEVPASGFNCDGTCIDTNGNGVCDFSEIYGCTDVNACNFDSKATILNESCLQLDDCEICGGGGIPEGACHCDGTLPNSGYDCDGNCLTDTDGDFVCDAFEITGCTNSEACNYNPSATDSGTCIVRDVIGECGGICTLDADGDLLCDHDTNGDGAPEDSCTTGNGIIDECGECGGTSTFTLEDNTTPCVPGTPGCTNASNECNCNGNTFDVVKTCGGNCLVDQDSDGICDLDADGNTADLFICDGPADVIGNCNGTCSTDADGDGLCDDDDDLDGFSDEDPCPNDPFNIIDECGICSGSGIPEGACDCSGSTEDAVGVCGGTCNSDGDNDGICDDNGNDPCVGDYDECGVCIGDSNFTLANGSPCDPGTPGCTNADGHCNCTGDTLDALNICAGDCTADDDGDGICDFDENGNPVDPCVGEYDACGVCEGLGEVFECGCADIPEGSCDCDLNKLDECNECGGAGPDFGKDCDGNCLGDADNDGICDVDEETLIPRVLLLSLNSGENPTSNLYLDHVRMQQTLDRFTLLHHLMTENLDDGSLTGSTRNLTIEKNMTSKGTLLAKGVSIFNTNIHIKGVLEVYRDLYVTGSATVGGSTVSRSGIVTTNVEVSGDASIGGNTNINGTLRTYGISQFRNSLDVSNNFAVYNGVTAASVPKFDVESSTGDVTIKGALSGSSDFVVSGYSELDALNVTGNATMDNATVDNPLVVSQDAEWLGNIVVGDSIFTINASSGDMRVKGNLEVGGDTYVLGNVVVQGDATIGGTTFANGGIETSSIIVEGDMDVAGNGTVAMSMGVGRNANIHKATGIGGNFTMHQGSTSGVLNATEVFSVKSATGQASALGNFTAKTARIGSNASFTGPMTLAGTLDVDGSSTSIGGDVFVDGGVTLGPATFGGNAEFSSSLTTDGSFTTLSDVAVNPATATVPVSGGNTNLNGQTTIVSSKEESALNVTVNRSDGFAARFRNTKSNGGQGIVFKSGDDQPGNDNNYVEFENGAMQVIGRIEGVLEGELAGDGDIDYARKSMDFATKSAAWEATNAGIALLLAGFDLFSAVSELAEWGTGSTACFGNGACATFPIPSMIVSAIAEIALNGTAFQSASIAVLEAGTNAAFAVETKNKYEAALQNGLVQIGNKKLGVTYQSGSGDYAEWLPKTDPMEQMEAGQIVGLKDGRIMFDTDQVDHVFVISTLPIVLGNVPQEPWRFEKVAFLGQVPVQVRGAVKSGDYIVASGRSDGYGIAVHPSEIRPEDFDQLVGVAWESGLKAFNTINVAVGLNAALTANAERLETQVNRIERETAAMKKVAIAFGQGQEPTPADLQLIGLLPPFIGAEEIQDAISTKPAEDMAWTVPGMDDIVVHKITPEGMDVALDKAIEIIRSKEMTEDTRQFIDGIENNETVRKTFADGMRARINGHNQDAIREMAKFRGIEITRPTTLRSIHERLSSEVEVNPTTPQKRL